MRLNGVLLSEDERLKLLADIHHEPDVTECEALENMVPAALAMRHDPLHELEKLQAAELVSRARNIDQHLQGMDNIERSAFGQATRRLAAELLEAARKSDRYRPEDVPEVWKKVGAI